MKYIHCISCKKVKSVSCTDVEYDNWQNGQLIQKAMPNVHADEIVLLISGICGPCFDKLFKEDL